MKISKVNHVKSGVSVESCCSKGILYHNPKKEQNNNHNLTKHVESLNRNAQRLYSIFSPNCIQLTNKGSEKKQCNDIHRLTKEIIKLVINNYRKDFSMEKNLSYQLNELDTWIKEYSDYERCLEKYRNLKNIKSTVIENMVDDCIRNSLRKRVQIYDSTDTIYFPDLIKKLLKSIIRTEIDVIETLTLAEKKTLLVELNKDYWKTEEIKKIVNSIERQNVHVQSVKRNGKYYLQLSNAEHKQKHYIFDFLKKFSEAVDESEREQLLVRFKQLVLLFYCGKSKYEEVVKFSIGAWNWGVYKEDAAVNFDDYVYELMNEMSARNDRNEKKRIGNKIKQELKKQIALHYREAIQVEGLTAEDIFWLQYIENAAEKMLLAKSDINPIHLSVSYLCDHTYKGWISYICMKYIDMGKGVYHFAKPGMEDVINGNRIIGEVLPEYQNGITSFDYERIKAEESLNRDVALYTTFAVENFARAVLSNEKRKESGMEDVLQKSINTLNGVMYKDAKRRILQFFGGQSIWGEDVINRVDTSNLVEAIKTELNIIRNSSFHYTTKIDKDKQEVNPVLFQMFSKEHGETGALYRKKYFSNNVLLFYSPKDITNLMDRLYDSTKERPAQIPAFNRIINKTNLEGFITNFVHGNNKKKLSSGEGSVERMEKFRASMFFILKEIYYFGFLQEENIKEMFLEAVSFPQIVNNGRVGNKDAYRNFKMRLDEITRNETITFGEICQQIMTDYNQQNQGKKIVSSNRKGHDDEKYKHFRMLLYIYTKEAFIKYLKNNKECYGFLQIPTKREAMAEEVTQEEFCEEWKPRLYDVLLKEVSGDNMLLAWYTTAHFLNQKQLNLLIGCIRNYIQYIQDVDRRSKDTGNRVAVDTDSKVTQYRKILSVLEFTMLFCGTITNCLEDYFKDEDDYAKHLADYVEFDLNGEKNSTVLKAFCSRTVKCGSPTGKIGLYYDEQKPIVNKNIVYARMYGNEKLFRNCFNKISERDINQYYKDMNNLSEIFKSGQCKEEKDLRHFQNEKNYIELTEIMTYSEIVNDFMGQLISWAYLRERDLMYFQLGFYYTKLYYGKSIEKTDKLCRLKGTNINIEEGAVLYQIIAMYTYDVPVLGVNEEGQAYIVKGSASNGESISAFLKNYCNRNEEIYKAGLCLFEDVEADHDDMVAFRNYIDHFKYYSHMDRCIMDLYSDVYDRYFNYDLKLKKSVSYIFKNILLRYFVISNTEILSEIRKGYCNKVDKRKERKKAKIAIKKNGLVSDVFKSSKQSSTSINEGKKDTILAREDRFLQQLKEILEYKECNI